MKIIKYVGAVIAISLLTSVSVQAAEEFKFAHVYEVSHPLHKAAEIAAEKIEKSTDGRVKIKVFPASQLGKEVAINEGLSFGTVDMIYTGAGFAGAAYGPISMTNFPFTLRGLDHWKNYRDSDLFKEISKGYSNATNNKSRVVALSYYGARHVTSNKPVVTPGDMKNLKIRVPNAPAYVIFPRETGANPTPMAFAEVYLALQQGVVDGAENNIPSFFTSKHYEVCKFLSIDEHTSVPDVLVIGTGTLDRLNEQEKKWLEEAVQDSKIAQRKLWEESEKECLDKAIKSGVKVNYPTKESFQEATKELVKEFEKDPLLGGLIHSIQNN